MDPRLEAALHNLGGALRRQGHSIARRDTNVAQVIHGNRAPRDYLIQLMAED